MYKHARMVGFGGWGTDGGGVEQAAGTCGDPGGRGGTEFFGIFFGGGFVGVLWGMSGDGGHGSKPMVPFWDRCTTHFRTYFSGDWDVHWGYRVFTHGHIVVGS